MTATQSATRPRRLLRRLALIVMVVLAVILVSVDRDPLTLVVAAVAFAIGLAIRPPAERRFRPGMAGETAPQPEADADASQLSDRAFTTPPPAAPCLLAGPKGGLTGGSGTRRTPGTACISGREASR